MKHGLLSQYCVIYSMINKTNLPLNFCFKQLYKCLCDMLWCDGAGLICTDLQVYESVGVLCCKCCTGCSITTHGADAITPPALRVPRSAQFLPPPHLCTITWPSYFGRLCSSDICIEDFCKAVRYGSIEMLLDPDTGYKLKSLIMGSEAMDLNSDQRWRM